MNIIATELDAVAQQVDFISWSNDAIWLSLCKPLLLLLLQTWIATSYLVAMNSFQGLAGKVWINLRNQGNHADTELQIDSSQTSLAGSIFFDSGYATFTDTALWRKPVVLFGSILFVVGSIVNSTTKNINGLIAGRTVQGAGAGCVISMLFVVIADIIPLPLRPRFQSMLTVC